MEGLQYLHNEAGMGHRDLKGENVMLHNMCLKIIDFGLADDADKPG